MNQLNDYRVEPNDDPALERVLSPLRSIEPPLVARVENRIAVAEALCSLMSANRKRRSAWWRRSISVPVPIAACFLVVCSLPLALRFHGESQPSPAHMAERERRPEHAVGASRETVTVAPGEPDARPVLVYRESATYVCGIGQLKSTRGYFFKEQDR
jgi:hypothetical protein